MDDNGNNGHEHQHGTPSLSMMHNNTTLGTEPMNEHHQSQSPGPSIFMPVEEFAHELEIKLGRANGNVYVRKPGVEGLHDGQIMVRLKKKRFIIIDYSIVPSPADVAYAAVTPNVLCPSGAGKQKCVSSDCTKVGVPVMLFDSDPEQPLSLYLRSGLCFTCQRLLNEKRRTQRKRKGEVNQSPGQHGHGHGHGMDGSGLQFGHPGVSAEHYAMETAKRFRLGGEILDLNPDAIIINGPLDDTKHHGPGYEYPEIGNDLQRITHEVSQETMQLASTVSSLGEVPFNINTQDHAQILGMYEKTFVSISKGIFLLSQWKSSWDSAVAAAAAEKATEQALDGSTIVDAVSSADVVASAAAVAAAQSVSGDQNSSNMIPLLLAANNNDKRDIETEDDVDLKVEHHHHHHDDDEKPEVFGV